VDLLTTSVTLVESAGDPYTLVTLDGEADVTNSAGLWEVLEAQLAREPRTVVVDLAGLRFMDSSALHVLLRATRAMDRHGGILALARPQSTVARMLALTAADQLIPIYDSVSEAAAVE
jgi:anti-sigma B factor antagonist